ncbi:hypothetical protein AB0A74_05200 [Saccharothrix sp. NPDC042600]|uniref:hypothetical protein n=1 Tax=Saccharothrix TaxID=2071 RepID=UPI0033E75922
MWQLTGVVLAVLLVGGCTADGGSERDQVVAKLKSDVRTQGAPERTVDCVADWYMEHASSEQREAFLDGGAESQADDESARAALLECVKTATDGQ